MTFPLGSANFSLLLRELWRWGRALLTNTITTSRISLAWACTSPSCGKAVHQMTPEPETHTRKHREWGASTHSVSLYGSLSFTRFVTHTKNFTDLTKSDNRDADIKQDLAKGTVPLGSSSPGSVFHHRCEWPMRFSCQSADVFSPQNTETGELSKTKAWSLSLSLCMSPSSLALSPDAAHVSKEASFLDSRMASKHRDGTQRARARCVLYHTLRQPVGRARWHCWC